MCMFMILSQKTAEPIYIFFKKGKLHFVRNLGSELYQVILKPDLLCLVSVKRAFRQALYEL
jgi:hypothetical protein